jgi:formate hydrogenlyase subunit 3/multisubunit Na+/H+ antiporter MnhD subunit
MELGPLANFAGLLHMTMHSLTKSGIFFGVGHIAQVKGSQRLADIGGLTITHPILGWTLVVGVMAIGGLPPFGIFTSEFLVVTSTFARSPWLAVPLVFGILLAFGALLLKMQDMAFRPTPGTARRPPICRCSCTSRWCWRPHPPALDAPGPAWRGCSMRREVGAEGWETGFKRLAAA